MVSVVLPFLLMHVFFRPVYTSDRLFFIMQISAKNVTLPLGNKHEKLSPVSVNVVNLVAELTQLKTGSRKNEKILLETGPCAGCQLKGQRTQ